MKFAVDIMANDGTLINRLLVPSHGCSSRFSSGWEPQADGEILTGLDVHPYSRSSPAKSPPPLAPVTEQKLDSPEFVEAMDKVDVAETLRELRDDVQELQS